MSRGHFIGINHHRVMLADRTRMEAYKSAIDLQVEPGMRVLDLGTGTGILAFWAAQAGAEVIAVEPHDVIEVAKRIAADNGLSDRITFIQSDSREIELEAPVDLVVTECMGNFFITDEMQPVLRDLPRLMAPDAKTIPRRISLSLAAASIPGWSELRFWEKPIGGLDFSAALDSAVQTAYVVDCDNYHLATTIARPADFALVEAPDDLEMKVTLDVVRDCTVHVLLGWFRAELGEGVVLTTRPEVRTHWGQMAFPIAVTQVREGDVVDAEVSLLMDETLQSRFLWRGLIRRDWKFDVFFSRDTSQRFHQRPDPPSEWP